MDTDPDPATEPDPDTASSPSRTPSRRRTPSPTATEPAAGSEPEADSESEADTEPGRAPDGWSTSYQDIISRLEARAEELTTTQAEVQRLEQQKQARGESEALKRLHELAGARGAKDPLDRLAALYLLATAYGNIVDGTHDLYRMQVLEDRFALQRIADVMVQRYWAEAAAVFPRVLPVVRDEIGFLPRSPEQVVEAVARARKQLEEGNGRIRVNCVRGEAREVRFLCNLDWQGMRDDPVHQFALRLHLDGRQTADLYQRLYDFGIKLNAPAEWRQRALEGLAAEYLSLGDFGRSTASYTLLAGLLHDAGQVRAVTRKVQDNRAIAESLERSPHRELIREIMANASHTDHGRVDPVSVGRQIEQFNKEPRYLFRRVGESRMFPESGRWGWGNADICILVADHPVWQVQAAQFALGTGPRPDPRRAGAIRYAPDSEVAADLDTLLVVDGAARRDVRLAFDVDFAVPADFWSFRGENTPHQADAKGRRPELGFVFGMRNIYAEPEKDPRTQSDVVVRPCRALAVIVGDGGVRLEELVQDGAGNLHAGVAHRGMKFAHKELGRQAADLRAAGSLKAAFEVTGGKVSATINGKAYTFPVPKDHEGFYGLAFAGNGFAELRGLQVRAK
ncbi:MAG: hypothetical protein E6J90_28710 [Deltaproteobacteria bacterium]|nr:MAG: hypothetical protein E6J90_28710 [Deltaproteobacteria bacterium]